MARKPSLSSPPPAPPPQPIVRKPSVREGQVSVVFWLDPVAREEFKIAAIRAGSTIQGACEDMLADWMRRQGARLPGASSPSNDH